MARCFKMQLELHMLNISDPISNLFQLFRSYGSQKQHKKFQLCLYCLLSSRTQQISRLTQLPVYSFEAKFIRQVDWNHAVKQWIVSSQCMPNYDSFANGDMDKMSFKKPIAQNGVEDEVATWKSPSLLTLPRPLPYYWIFGLIWQKNQLVLG